MNNSDLKWVQDSEVVKAALDRVIRNRQGGLITNFAFAEHLFFCARDLLPFDDALQIYGYVRDDFNQEQLLCFEKCYNIGNSHLKREITARLARMDTTGRTIALDTLERIWELYVKSDEEAVGNVVVNIGRRDDIELDEQ